MIPFRFSILTCNLWNTEKWDLRKKALDNFLGRFNPDICCFQEIRIQTMKEIDKMMPCHKRIHDSFNGWNNESNIYYRADLFSKEEHGEVYLNMPEEDRRLFWVKLKENETDRMLTVATVHLTHQNNADEQNTGQSYRHGEAVKIAKWLKENDNRNQNLILTGDFNDPLHPGRILTEAGLKDSFNELGLLQPSTFPNYPMTDEINMNESIDKIMFQGTLKPLLASVPLFYFQGAGLSDHHPVMAVFSQST